MRVLRSHDTSTRLPQSATSRQSSSELSNNGRSLLLQLPLDVLLLIAKSVAELRQDSVCEMSILPQRELTTFHNLSVTNKVLRDVCIAMGLFSRLTPRPLIETLQPLFEPLLLEYHGKPPLKSLTVDLGNPEIWEMCSDIMGAFPKLDELVLTGWPKRMVNRFRNSTLTSRFASFKGTTLVLKRAYLTVSSADILQILSRSRLRSLYLIESMFEQGAFWDVRLDCPGLKKVVFRGPPMKNIHTLHNTLSTYRIICTMFDNSKIAHFELSLGFKPRLSPNRRPMDDERYCSEQGSTAENRFYWMARLSILRDLRVLAFQSLRSFVDLDGLCGPFVDIPQLYNPYTYTLLPYWEMSFKKMQLLVFRCSQLKSLTAFDGIDDCTSGKFFRAAAASDPHGWRDHSIWHHVRSLTFIDIDILDIVHVCIFLGM